MLCLIVLYTWQYRGKPGKSLPHGDVALVSKSQETLLKTASLETKQLAAHWLNRYLLNPVN